MRQEIIARRARLKALKAERDRLAAKIAVLENRKRLFDECIPFFEQPVPTPKK